MYLSYFKLHREPFTLSPSLELYCDLPGHQGAIRLLKYGLTQGECLMKITGDVGVGKTLLCRKLLESLGEDYISCYIFNPYFSAEELLKAIATDLGIKDLDDKQRFDLVSTINDKLIEHHKSGKKVVVLIDESHLLTDEALEVLRLLTNLETSSRKLLHIILIGQQELNDRLSRPALRQINQRISYAYCIGGIDRDNTHKYVTRRLLASGHDCGDLFSKGALRLLHTTSSGIPRVINILCNKSLLLACSMGQAIVSRKLMRRAVRDSQDLVDTVQGKQRGSSLLVIYGLPLLALISAVAAVGYYFLGLH